MDVSQFVRMNKAGLKSELYMLLQKVPFLKHGLGWVLQLLLRLTVKRKVYGENNSILLNDVFLSHVIFDINGSNNSIVIGDGARISGLRIRMRGDNHQLTIGSGCRFHQGGVLWFEDSNCSLSIGDNTSVVEACIAVTEPYSRIDIGKDCLLAYDIDIRCGDSHSIIDLASNTRVNLAKDIKIDNHVWIAAHVQILKGVTIGSSSVIGAGSVVTKSLASNVVAAGVPAKVIREGITWDYERLHNQEVAADALPMEGDT